MAEQLLEEDPSLVFTKQFENAANPAVHFLTTGPEIWAQTQRKVDVFLAGVGTGGTVTGTFSLANVHHLNLLDLFSQIKTCCFVCRCRRVPQVQEGRREDHCY